MSVQSEIARISENVQNSLNAVAEQGVSVPAGATSDNLAELITKIGGDCKITVAKSGTTTTITVTDKDGTQIATIQDGASQSPLYANSIEECTDTTKLYVLPDGMIYAYMKKTVEGGENFTNLADFTSEDWYHSYQFKSTGEFNYYTVNDPIYFISNAFSAKAGQVLRIKGNFQAGSGECLRLCAYTSEEALFENKLDSPRYLTRSVEETSNNLHVGNHVTVTPDPDDSNSKTYEYTLRIGGKGTGTQTLTAGTQYWFRVSGKFLGTPGDIIITVDEPIEYTDGYEYEEWVGTGHEFVPADYEDRIISLENQTEKNRKDISNLKNNMEGNSGAIWFALGDSITQGWTSKIDPDTTDGYSWYLDTSNRWTNIVAQKNGYSLVNYGTHSMGYVQGENNARVVADTIDFGECDFVTLAYGYNDWSYSANIGSLDDDVSVGGSMVSNLRYVITKILTDNPYCKIFVITPINSWNRGSYETNWSLNYDGSDRNGIGLEYVFEKISEVCDYYGVELIDMTHSSIVNRENIHTALADKIHPTVECHEVMARELSRKIKFV